MRVRGSHQRPQASSKHPHSPHMSAVGEILAALHCHVTGLVARPNRLPSEVDSEHWPVSRSNVPSHLGMNKAAPTSRTRGELS
eukprot:scaffold605_cov400-Prasinococcus_capsulatus_cf.AAC.16